MKLEKNEIYQGFIIEKNESIEDIHAEGITFKHLETGAKLFFLKNKDDNKVFNIAFATPPEDDCGTPHILEHSILCGSKNYPARESFIELAKSSLKTFINAFTFPDKTMYPVASMNHRDFINLITVYLDAVFQPSLLEKEDIFLQEGWHYEIDEDGKLIYQGVVYNEMKGVYSSPDALIRRKIQDCLFPDTCYGKESGGDPDAIPELTFEGFKEFYKRHYFPKNSSIFLYGNFSDWELEEALKTINNKLLEARVDENQKPIEIKTQMPFKKRKRIKLPVPAEEDLGDKGYYGFGWCIGNTLDSELAFSMDVLTHLLAGTPSSPLKRKLVEKRIGRDVILSHDSGILQTTLSLSIRGGKKGRLDQVESAVRECLEKLVLEGIDQELIEASLNYVEFQFREADFGGYPKGLIYSLQVAETWLYGGDPTARLRFEDRLKRIRGAITEGYFEALIEKYMLSNKHAVEIELYEEVGLTIKNEIKNTGKMFRIKESMTDDELKELEKTARVLREIQNTGDETGDLCKLPLLKLSEININNIEKNRVWSGKNVVMTELDTSGVSYAAAYYICDIKEKGIHPGFGNILSEMLSNVNANEVDYGDLQRRILRDTGGLSFGSGIFSRKETQLPYLPFFSIKARSLDLKTSDTVDLIHEIINGTQALPNDRFFEIIGEMTTRMETSMMQDAHNFIMMKMAARLFDWGEYLDETKGLGLYSLLKELTPEKGQTDRIISGLTAALECFVKPQILTSVVGGFGDKSGMQFSNLKREPDREGFAIEKHSNQKDFYDCNKPFEPQKINEAYYTGSLINYCGLAYDFTGTGIKYSGEMKVLASILRYGYLWNEVRVKGGAYGAFFNIDRTGYMSMISYRDPRIRGTLNDFKNAADYLEKFYPTEEEMRKYIIGTISGFDSPRTNSAECDRTAELSLKGITNEMLQIEREEILGTTPEKIRGYSELLREMGKSGNIMVIGQREALERESEQFDFIQRLI